MLQLLSCSLSTPVYAATTISLLLSLTCLGTWLITTIRYKLAVNQFQKRLLDSTDNNQRSRPIEPPTLPYMVPWLGSAASFVTDTPGSFWRSLYKKLAPTKMGACSLMMGGMRMHIITSPTAIQALFKTKHASRDVFNRDVVIKALGLSLEDVDKYQPRFDKTSEAKGEKTNKGDVFEKINLEFLLTQTAVNSLTKEFMKRFREELSAYDFDEWKPVNVYEMVNKIMTKASIIALMGTKIWEMNPNFSRQYWEFDGGFLLRYLGVPRWLSPKCYQGVDELLSETQRWIEYCLEKDDRYAREEPDWEPLMGSKVIRARHRTYAKHGISIKGRARLDLGFMFGLVSNSVPAVGWILFHLFSPATPTDVLSRVLAEIETAKRDDGDIDISILMGLPLLNSIFNETLRLYTDVLVSREILEDMVLDQYCVKKHDLVFASSYYGHHNPATWSTPETPPVEEWYAERFLDFDAVKKRPVFRTPGTAGQLYPFGGGTAMCPGRVFAKQEVLGSVAVFLMTYDFEFIEHLRKDRNGHLIGNGQGQKAFPRVKKQYSGAGVVLMDGDMRMKIRRRSQE